MGILVEGPRWFPVVPGEGVGDAGCLSNGLRIIYLMTS